MTSIDKTKSKGSIKSKDKNNTINKSLKNLNNMLKQQRSSTTYLNQYSKLVLLQNNEIKKSSVFIKKHSISTNNLLKIPITQNKLFQNAPHNQEKLNKILQTLKKKKLQSVSAQPTSNITPDIKQDIVKASRITKTSQSASRNSLQSKKPNVGKLLLGKNYLPQKVPTKQQRWDPFYQESRIISQDLITRKGVYNLINTGLLPSQYDFLQILNNKYQLIPQVTKVAQYKSEVVSTVQDETQTFMTNPALLNQYQAHRKMSQAQLNVQQNQRKKNQQAQRKRNHKIRKSKIKKTKIVVNDPLQKISEFFVIELPFLSIVDGRIDKDENYAKFFKKSLKQGFDQDFNQLVKKMQEFSKKYQIKKFKFKPVLGFGRRITQRNLIQMIQNFKILGYDRTINKKKNILESVIRRAFDMHHIKKIKVYLKKVQNFKKYFRMRKFYYEYVQKRYNFYKYRLESFAEEQRKFIQDFVQKKMFIANYNPKVEIHILTKQDNFAEEKSYYKLRERLRAQLMRIFNSQPADIIFLVDPEMIGNVNQEMEILIKMAMKLGEKLSNITKKIPRIHIFQTTMKGGAVSSTGRTYYGIISEIIKLVKDICNGQKPVLIPYESCSLLPFLCEVLNANLFGGTFTKESLKILWQDEKLAQQLNSQQQNIPSNDTKFKLIKRLPTFQARISKFKNLKLTNEFFQDKSNIYQLFSTKLKKKMPFRISTKNKSQAQFYEEVVSKISSCKESTKWIFKLPKGKFSRGIGLLETNDLKVFQQSRKKQQLTEKQKVQISKLMSIILKDKIILSQPYLMQKHNFLSEFFTKQNSYIQEYIQNSQKICIFGKILPNGTFVFMGTYKKYYTNGVGFGASYPAQQVDESMIEQLKQISQELGRENVFGYVTFQLLYQQRSKRFLYIDFTPNLDEYSSFYFLYDTLFKSSQLYEQDRQFNTLPKRLFYCPFLDNNGNKFTQIQEFLDQCRQRKVWYDSTNYEGQMFLFLKNDPSMLGLITFSNSQYHSIKLCIDAISLLVELGGKFNQFDKKYMGCQDLKTDGLYIMEILWKLRQIRKKMQISQQTHGYQNINKNC